MRRAADFIKGTCTGKGEPVNAQRLPVGLVMTRLIREIRAGQLEPPSAFKPAGRNQNPRSNSLEGAVGAGAVGVEGGEGGERRVTSWLSLISSASAPADAWRHRTLSSIPATGTLSAEYRHPLAPHETEAHGFSHVAEGGSDFLGLSPEGREGTRKHMSVVAKYTTMEYGPAPRGPEGNLVWPTRTSAALPHLVGAAKMECRHQKENILKDQSRSRNLGKR